MRCPECGAKFDLNEGMLSEDVWTIVDNLLTVFGDDGNLVLEYLQLFGVRSLTKQSKKALRLVKELAKFFSNGRYDYNGKIYAISQRGIIEALVIVCNHHFKTPLKNHNYLKTVMRVFISVGVGCADPTRAAHRSPKCVVSLSPGFGILSTP